MDTLSYKTISANKATVTKEWVIVDATDQVLGRLGAKVAKLLRGKYKPDFTPPARLQAKPNGDDKLLRKVVKGMLPKNKLGAKLLGNMYVYAGSEHKHDAQNPKMIDINVLK